MKLNDTGKVSPSFQDLTEMFSKMKTLLIDVLLEKSLPDESRIKLKDCISMVESFSNFINNHFKENDENSTDFLQPVHSGLSKSLDSLNLKTTQLSGSRSASSLQDLKLYDGDDGDAVDITNLKTNYRQAVNELKNINHERNGSAKQELNQVKPDLNSDKLETNKYELEIDKTNNALRKSNEKYNFCEPVVNGVDLSAAEPEMNALKPVETNNTVESAVNGSTTEVVKREGDSSASRRRRKRDSSTLFDISLDDLTEPDHSGFLTEKHAGKEWWCVLQDQHLCMFPSQNPQELAYDVLLVPCCEISLDDVFNESPVFRLTQIGSTPWVFSAGIERNLRAWIRALYRACGRDDADWSMRSPKKGRRRGEKKRNMKVLTSTIDESEEVEEEMSRKNGAKTGENEEFENEGRGTGFEEVLVQNRSDPVKKLEEERKQKDEVKTKEGEGLKHDISRNNEMVLSGEKSKNKECNDMKVTDNEKESTSASDSNVNHQLFVIETPNDHEKELVSEFETNKTSSERKFVDVRKEASSLEMKDALQGTFVEKQKSKGDFIDDKSSYKTGRNGIENRYNKMRPTYSTFDDEYSNNGVSKICPIREKNLSNKSCSLPSNLKLGADVEMNTLERKATKKRIKMLRWLRKAIVDKGQDKVAVIGDIYRVEGMDHVKLWCLLRNRQLYCYRSVCDDSPDLVIPLDNCIAVPSICTTGKGYFFNIEKDGVKLVTFAARCATERARWIEVVKRKRGMILLGELCKDDSDEEGEGSRTSEEDGKDWDENEYEDCRYVIANSVKPGPEYVLAMSEDEVDDAGYISTLALESEIRRRKSLKKNNKHNPNSTNKAGIEHLIERETALHIGSPPRYSSLPRKDRSPAPLPKEAWSSEMVEDSIYDTIVSFQFDVDGDKDANGNDDTAVTEKYCGEISKPKKAKKKGDKSPTTKVHLKKEDISAPMNPSSDCLKTALVDPACIKENAVKFANAGEQVAGEEASASDNPASTECRFKLTEKLLLREKRGQITKLEILKKHVDQAKDRMIVVNASGQLKREAIESEHDFLTANLELVKAKKRLIDIEAEIRELRLSGEKENGEILEEERPKEIAKPSKSSLKRRPSKEIGMCTDAVSPVVDKEAFNSPGDSPPPRKVMNSVKLFENLQNV